MLTPLSLFGTNPAIRMEAAFLLDLLFRCLFFFLYE
jgi:hypothetical protein